jgi:phosphoserine phosphatase
MSHQLPTEVTVTGETLLLTVAGRDRPGVSKALFGALSAHDVLILDVEQIVLNGRLILATSVAPSPASSVEVLDAARAAAQRVADDLGLELTDVRTAHASETSEQQRVHVTLLGAPLLPAALSTIASRIADSGGNIDRIERLAAYPVTALELDVSGADPVELRAVLTATATASGVDIAVQRTGLHRRGKRLVVIDVDSTLIQGEVIEMLAERAGCGDEVCRITEAAMRGELDFEQSLRARVSLLAGLSASDVAEVGERVQLAPGARTLVRTLNRLGYRCGIVSGGFSQITDRLVEELALDFSAANTLDVRDGVLTGGLVGPVVDRAGKATALRRFAEASGVPLTQTVAIGDGANDLDMLAIAGLGVAFNAKPLVRAAADTAVNVPYLDSILFLLGISREEIDAAATPLR